TVNSATEVNALVMKSGGSLTGTGTLKVSSGTVLLAGAGVSVGTLDFGTAEGVIHTVGGGFTISSLITGSNGLTVAGGGSLTLTNTANSYQSGTIVSRTLALMTDAALAAPAGGITVIGVLRALAPVTSARPLAVGNGATVDTNSFSLTVGGLSGGNGSGSFLKT